MLPSVTLLVLFLALAQGCTKNDVVTCALTHIDTNGDNQITVAELDHFLMENTCGVQISDVTGTSIMGFCDYNKDGVLTAADDINGATMPCLYSEPLRKMICVECAKCDTNTAKRYY